MLSYIYSHTLRFVHSHQTHSCAHELDVLRRCVGCQKAYIYSHTLRIFRSLDTFVRARKSARTRHAAQACRVSEGPIYSAACYHILTLKPYTSARTRRAVQMCRVSESPVYSTLCYHIHILTPYIPVRTRRNIKHCTARVVKLHVEGFA